MRRHPRRHEAVRLSLGRRDLLCIPVATRAPRGDTACMAFRAWSPDRLAGELTRLGARALGPEAYFEEVSARLQRAVPSRANCWHTLDPETRLLTSEAPQELIASGVYSPETAPAAGQAI